MDVARMAIKKRYVPVEVVEAPRGAVHVRGGNNHNRDKPLLGDNEERRWTMARGDGGDERL